jgi:hypothetical protein
MIQSLVNPEQLKQISPDELAEDRTEKPKSPSTNDLALDRTELAKFRSLAAADRTLMALDTHRSFVNWFWFRYPCFGQGDRANPCL